jgi:hypothetical protein
MFQSIDRVRSIVFRAGPFWFERNNMTAGQRNCYEAIQQLSESYGLDDVLYAAGQVVAANIRDVPGRAATLAFHHIESARHAIAREAVAPEAP